MARSAPRAAPLTLVVMGVLAACGARTGPPDACDAGPPRWQRFEGPVRCQPAEQEPGILVIATRDDWDRACDADPPEGLDLDEQALVGVYLEGGCAYSGCSSTAELVADIDEEAGGCRLVIVTVDDPGLDLGACHACVQPIDWIVIEKPAALGNLELD